VDINRNQWFMLGLIVLFLGIQFRVVESFELNENVTRFINERTAAVKGTATASVGQFLPSVGPTAHKTITPPDWIGWMLMSVGSVLILHSLAMKRPEG